MRNFTLRKLALAILFVFIMIAIEMITLEYLGMGTHPTYWIFDIGWFVILASIFFLLPFLLQNILSVVFMVIEGALCYTTICVYASTGRIFEWSFLALLGETEAAMSMAVFPLKPLFAIIGFILIYGLFWFFSRKIKKPSYKIYIKGIITASSLVLLSIMVAMLGMTSNTILSSYEIQTYFTSDSYNYTTFDSPYVSFKKFGLFGYYGVSLARIVVPSLTPEIKVSPEDFSFEAYSSILTNLCEDDNVIFILGESMEDYVISKELTPVLYALKNGIDLSNVGISNFYKVTSLANGEKELERKDYTYNQGSNTYTKNGVNIYEGLNEDEVGLELTNYRSYESTNFSENRVLTGNHVTQTYSMPKMFKGAGYTTNYIHCNYDWFYERGETMREGYSFDNVVFYDQMQEFLPNNDALALFTLDSLAVNHYLANPNEFDLLPENKFFTFFLTITTHGSYYDLNNVTMLDPYYALFDGAFNSGAQDDTLDVYRTLTDEKLIKSMRNFYAKAMDTEKSVALLVNELYETGRLEDTIICFVSDHYSYSEVVVGFKNEYLNYHNLNEVQSDLFQVPCFIYSPKITSELLTTNGYTRNISQLTQAYDLAPTILTLTGVEFDQSLYLGYCVVNTSLTDGKWIKTKFVYSDTNKLFFNNDCLTYDGIEYITENELSEEYKQEFNNLINDFRARQYFIRYSMNY